MKRILITLIAVLLLEAAASAQIRFTERRFGYYFENIEEPLQLIKERDQSIDLDKTKTVPFYDCKDGREFGFSILYDSEGYYLYLVFYTRIVDKESPLKYNVSHLFGNNKHKRKIVNIKTNDSHSKYSLIMDDGAHIDIKFDFKYDPEDKYNADMSVRSYPDTENRYLSTSNYRAIQDNDN